jgi:hypothetical protein
MHLQLHQVAEQAQAVLDVCMFDTTPMMLQVQ